MLNITKAYVASTCMCWHSFKSWRYAGAYFEMTKLEPDEEFDAALCEGKNVKVLFRNQCKVANVKFILYFTWTKQKQVLVYNQISGLI